MTKHIITYFFSIILLVSIVTPSYLSILEGTYEVTEVADLGEEEENKGNETTKDLDVKIYYPQNSPFFQANLEEEKRVSFYSKNYTSFHKKLISPPPEGLS